MFTVREARDRPHIITVGGGTGQSNLLRGLAHQEHLEPKARRLLEIDALINMADDGGSTGYLRRELDSLPPGDTRQVLGALSVNREVAEALGRRIETATVGQGLDQHTGGNVLLAILEQHFNFSDAIKVVSELYRIDRDHRAVPVTLDRTDLVYIKPDGSRVVGQRDIGQDVRFESKPELLLQPKPRINKGAVRAVNSADLAVIAPGNLYGSILPPLMVGGLGKLIDRADIPVVMISNVTNYAKHTSGFSVAKYVDELDRVAGVGVDIVIANDPSVLLTSEYGKSPTDEFSEPVEIDRKELETRGIELIVDDFLVYRERPDRTNVVRPSFAHDSAKLADAVLDIITRHVDRPHIREPVE